MSSCFKKSELNGSNMIFWNWNENYIEHENYTAFTIGAYISEINLQNVNHIFVYLTIEIWK